jgi:hypothetical protein
MNKRNANKNKEITKKGCCINEFKQLHLQD